MLKHIIRFCFGAVPTLIVFFILLILSRQEPAILEITLLGIAIIFLICGIYLLGYLLYDGTYKYFRRR